MRAKRDKNGMKYKFNHDFHRSRKQKMVWEMSFRPSFAREESNYQPMAVDRRCAEHI